MTKIQPKDTIPYNEIPHYMAINKDGIKKGTESDYVWYNNYGTYYPHRKPTINEILTNKFN